MHNSITRKNTLPIGNNTDTYPAWNNKRFIHYTMPTDKVNTKWCMLNDFGRYRCVNGHGERLNNEKIRVMVKGGELKLKIVYGGEPLNRYDIYLEELLPLKEGQMGTLRYSKGEIVVNETSTDIVRLGFSSEVYHEETALKTYIDENGSQRYLLSLGTDRSNSKFVDVLVTNSSKGVSRHIRRSNIRDIMPSVISIPTFDISKVINDIGESWEGDTLGVYVLVGDAEPLKFKLNSLRHDTHLAVHGTTKELLSSIVGIASGLDKNMEIGYEEGCKTDVVDLSVNGYSSTYDAVTLKESSAHVTIGTKTLEVNEQVPKERSKIHLWKTVSKVKAGPIKFNTSISRPSIPYSVYMIAGNESRDVTNDTTLLKTTDNTLTSIVDGVSLYLINKGCSRMESGQVPLNQTMVNIEGPLLKFIEVKLNDTWLRAGIDFLIYKSKIVFLKPIIKGADTYAMVTHGDSPWTGRFANVNAVCINNEFPKIQGAYPDDIVVVNCKRYRYDQIVGMGVMVNDAYSFLPLHEDKISVKSKHTTIMVYSEFRRKVCDWLSDMTNKELALTEPDDIRGNAGLMELLELQTRIEERGKYVYMTFTTDESPINRLSDMFSELVLSKSMELFRSL